MSQSLTKLYAHLIFSTKHRQPFLDEAIRPRIHAYLATIVRNLDSPWVVVGGVADHVHILFDMGKLHCALWTSSTSVKRESSKVRQDARTTVQGFLLAAWLWNVLRGSRATR